MIKGKGCGILYSSPGHELVLSQNWLKTEFSGADSVGQPGGGARSGCRDTKPD